MNAKETFDYHKDNKNHPWIILTQDNNKTFIKPYKFKKKQNEKNE